MQRLNRFVALDVETTGLSPEGDQIIQVGAVRFEHGESVDEMVLLVNPGGGLSQAVVTLTGITRKMLEGAPSAARAKAALREFIGADPIVAHNVDFHIGFLVRVDPWFAGVTAVDMIDFARVAIPDLASYSLQSISGTLGISQPRSHDALEHARACGLAFLRLVDVLLTCEAGMLQGAGHLLESGGLAAGRLLVELAQEARGRPQPDREANPEPLKPLDNPAEVDPKECMALLQAGGPLAAEIPCFEVRPGQLAMARLICQAFREQRHLMVEAGTGTGKSLAYLVPSVLHAVATGERVVIATHTLNLQEQLFNKDIPLLSQVTAKEFRVACIKGRNNYLCRRKWASAVTEAALVRDKDRARLLAWLFSWGSRTKTGERQEINLPASADDLWQELASDTSSCAGARCLARKSCFVGAARAQAAASHLVITNHSLLFSDFKTDNQVLPRYSRLVVDEAHHLEEAATRHLGTELDFYHIASTLSADGYLLSLKGRISGSRAFSSKVKAALLEAIDSSQKAARSAVTALTDLGSALVSICFGDRQEDVRTRRILPDTFAKMPKDADVALENTGYWLNKLFQEMEEGALAIEDTDDTDAGCIQAEMTNLAQELSEWCRLLPELITAQDPASVYWADWYPARGALGIHLHAAPVEVGPLLRQLLFDNLKTVILTSATLSVEGRFSYAASRLGLEDCERFDFHQVPSNFSYKEQALLLVVDDLPDPNLTREFSDAVAAFLLNLGRALKGRTLVLFTSHRMLKDVAQKIRLDYTGLGIELLAQGVDGARRHLTEQFRANSCSILFGSASFWEGVDLPGEELVCVVLVRLPFWPPDVPVVQARMEAIAGRGGDPFREYSLPEAVIRFKQGFGRLIRTASDRGAVVVLDPRMTRARYSRVFVSSLPGPMCVRVSARQSIPTLLEWLRS
ncbi:MAG: helicase C-terminal domain-containing protein [Bacillota bacterium]